MGDKFDLHLVLAQVLLDVFTLLSAKTRFFRSASLTWTISLFFVAAGCAVLRLAVRRGQRRLRAAEGGSKGAPTIAAAVGFVWRTWSCSLSAGSGAPPCPQGISDIIARPPAAPVREARRRPATHR
ncbi:MAG: hypothetical protein IPO58_26520 [Betaproteobacteria bacterium]|nr:hypothetical protein [Betaproteobacteria bacterium]